MSARSVRVTTKVKAAIALMVFEGLKRDEAAQRVGMKDNSLYVAFRKAETKAYYLQQCEVLRVSGRARRIHRLESIAESDNNAMAAVRAIQVLDAPNIEAERAANGPVTRPGLIIVIQDRAPIAPAAKPLTIDVESRSMVPASATLDPIAE